MPSGMAMRNSKTVATAATKNEVPILSALKISLSTGRWLMKLLPKSPLNTLPSQVK